jgi:hypothetical protein
MGVRGELFSTKLMSEKRTYFFNVKENRLGDVFLTIVESKKGGEEAEFERHQVMVYEEEIDTFIKEFQKAAEVVRKHKQVAAKPARKPAARPAAHPTGEGAEARPARPRKPAADRPEPVPTYGFDGKWEGPEAMKAKGGKVARISRKEVEARAAEKAKAAESAAADTAAKPAPKAPRKPKPAQE